MPENEIIREGIIAAIPAAICLLMILVSVIGCFLSRYPAPVLAFIAVILAKIYLPVNIATWQVWAIGLLTAACVIINYLIPRWFNGIRRFSAWGKWGTIAGSLIAIVLIPHILLEDGTLADNAVRAAIIFVGLPPALAFSLELIGQRSAFGALKSGLTATVAYYASTIVKIAVIGASAYLIASNYI